MAFRNDNEFDNKCKPSDVHSLHLREQVPTDANLSNSSVETSAPPIPIEDASSSSDSNSMPCSSVPSQQIFKPRIGHMPFNITESTSAREIIVKLFPGVRFPSDIDEMTLWSIIFDFWNDVGRRRNKLQQYNTLEDAVNLIKKSKKIIVLSGAGISTSSGIPDFRSRDGVYARLHVDFPDLPDPKAMFDISYFSHNPRPFFKFAKEIYPGQFQPAIGHKFIKCIENQNKLLRNYTQNIDTLEQQAGIKNIIECHGSFATASCTRCNYKTDCEAIREDIEQQKIPLCPTCSTSWVQTKDDMAVMKPDIVFFGEALSDKFHNAFESDKDDVDLLIVIGSSLKVKPVALIPTSIPKSVPQILINREPLDHFEFDIELLGNCDEIIQELCLRLGSGWSNICSSTAKRLEPIKGNLDEILPTLIPNKKQHSDCLMAQVGSKDVSMESLDKIVNCGNTQSTVTSSRTKDWQSSNNSEKHNQLEPETAEFSTNKIINSSETFALEEVSSHSKDMIEDRNSKGEATSSTKKDEDSDDDWEDVESSCPSSCPSGSSDQSFKVNREDIVQVPDSSYLFVSPSRYIFKGAEVARADIEMCVSSAKNKASAPSNEQD